MGFYETTYILHSALQEGRLNDIVNTIQKKAESLGAKFLHSDNWGRKKLSYLIDKEKYGTYIFVQYSLQDSKVLKELSAEFEHNPNVLRYLNIKIEEEDIIQSIVQEINESDNKKIEEVKNEDDKKSVDDKKEESEKIIKEDDSDKKPSTENDDKDENSGDNK